MGMCATYSVIRKNEEGTYTMTLATVQWSTLGIELYNEILADWNKAGFNKEQQKEKLMEIVDRISMFDHISSFGYTKKETEDKYRETGISKGTIFDTITEDGVDYYLYLRETRDLGSAFTATSASKNELISLAKNHCHNQDGVSTIVTVEDDNITITTFGDKKYYSGECGTIVL